MVTGDTTTDLVVIGAGPGGYTAAISGAKRGLDVVVVEKENVGGVCVNHGCIPAKALIHAAGFQKDIQHWNDIGIHTGELAVDFGEVQAWKNSVIDRLGESIVRKFDKYGVEYRNGTASFLDSNRVSVEREGGEDLVEFDHAVVATGSQPLEIPGLEFHRDGVISSREILQVEEVPDEIIVVGGGYIGMEAVTKFSKFGSNITVVEALDRVLTMFEEEVVESIQETSSELYNTEIYTSTWAQGVEYEDGKPVLVVERDGETHRLHGDYIIVAAGRETRTTRETLGLEHTDVTVNDEGFIATDEQMRTTDENVFCVGDAAGEPFLAHVAYREGEVAGSVAAGEDVAFDNQYVPAVMFTDPEVAVVGLTEEEASEEYGDVRVGRFPLSASGRALSANKSSGYVKVVAAPDETLLGVQIVGARASDMIAEATLALELDASLTDITSTIHAHPTFPEALSEAAEAAREDAFRAG